MTIEVIGQNMLDNPAVGGIVVNSRDISERKRLEEQLTHQAYHDPLTGLANRALFIKQIEAGLARLDQTRRMCAILFLDLDNFKSINDTLGHQSGDQLLTSVTQHLQTCTRQNDMAARIGGDEFAILLPDIAAESDAIAVANRIIAGLQKPFQVGDHEVSTSTSIGIAFGSSSRLSAGDLLRQADMAMYNAKTGGKSRYSVFDEALVYSLK
jgi:diguanylate cyclase (GGDEF)-like protein